MTFAEHRDWTSCEAMAFARHVVGDYRPPETRSRLIGGYVRALLAGGVALEAFVAARAAALRTRAGKPRATAVRAEAMAAVLRSDPLCASRLAGGGAVVRGVFGGLDWELSVDSLDVGSGFFADVVSSRALDHWAWSPAHRARVPFWELHGYWTRLALTSHLLRQRTGMELEPLLVVVSDEPVPGKLVLSFANPARLACELAAVRALSPRVATVKAGKLPPAYCGVCDYCKQRRPLERVHPASSHPLAAA